jgi:SAM-dependent methyltransferase
MPEDVQNVGIEEQLRAGALDLCDLVLTPDRFPEWRSPAESTPLEALLVAEPDIGERNAARVLRTGHVRPEDTLGDLDSERRAWLGEMVLFWRRQGLEPSKEISPNDGMYQKTTPNRYYSVGQTAVRRIRIAMLEARVNQLTSILDFGCGYGRVLRTLRVAFPDAKLTACDIERDRVDFCAEAFGATPVYSGIESKDVAFEGHGPFDLIWMGSVFSHLNAVRWRDFLSTFESLLSPGGLLVFTSQGRRVAEGLRRRDLWDLDEKMVEKLLTGYDEHGFGFDNYPGYDRGLALAKPSWVCSELDQHPELRLLGLRERGWGIQDTVSCMRADAEELAFTGRV